MLLRFFTHIVAAAYNVRVATSLAGLNSSEQAALRLLFGQPQIQNHDRHLGIFHRNPRAVDQTLFGYPLTAIRTVDLGDVLPISGSETWADFIVPAQPKVELKCARELETGCVTLDAEDTDVGSTDELRGNLTNAMDSRHARQAGATTSHHTHLHLRHQGGSKSDDRGSSSTSSSVQPASELSSSRSGRGDSPEDAPAAPRPTTPAPAGRSSAAGVRLGGRINVACDATPSWTVVNISEVLPLFSRSSVYELGRGVVRKISQILTKALPHVHLNGADILPSQIVPWGYTYFSGTCDLWRWSGVE